MRIVGEPQRRSDSGGAERPLQLVEERTVACRARLVAVVREPGQRVTHGLQLGDALIDIGQLRERTLADPLARRARGDAQGQQALHLGEREAEGRGATDEGEAADHLGVVLSLPGRRAANATEESFSLVETDRVDRKLGESSDVPDLERSFLGSRHGPSMYLEFTLGFKNVARGCQARLIPGLNSRYMLIGMRSQLAVVVTAVSLSLVACDKKSNPDPAPKADKGAARTAQTSKLGDLSTSLAAAREAFNARKGQARFLTLLSPT
jgi:hypothetical protein